jgi:CubicO group peptidase (beta-lactamase class C family)
MLAIIVGNAVAFASEPTDPTELEAFLDGVITAQLNAYHIPGATVAIVNDGKLFFAKGYGYADLDEGKAVVADQTLFRIASVSKLFTWTAVMQLVEQGKLDLNADVNMYLNAFQIPETYPQPITLTHLMTHTPGFEERAVGMMARNADDLLPLGDFLAYNMPARVRPPGEFSAYSNYGVALAGYIVEQVSGISFNQYVEENILNPLDMHNSTFRQPLPPELIADMSVGYTYANGVYHEQPFEYIQDPPAGSMSTTATDMAKFMITHLQDGRYEDARILQDSTAQQMHQQLFAHDPRVSGWAYGFMELNLNNQRMIWHGGSLLYFHTILVLLPEHSVGLFVSYNSVGGAEARYVLLQAFLDRYYPVPATATPQPPADFLQRASQFTGSYRTTRSAYTTAEKLVNLFAPVDVTASPDGTLLTTGLGDPTRWAEVEPLVFHPTGDHPPLANSLVFLEDDQGHITHFLLNNNPTFAFERVAWYENATFTHTLLGVCITLFLSAVILWPIVFIIRRRKSEAGAPHHFLPRLARWLTSGVSALNMLFFVGFLIAASNQTEFAFGVPPLVIALLIIVLAVSVLAFASVVFTVLAWKEGYWSLVERVHYTLVTVAALAFVWWLNNWNLLGFRF